MTAADVLIESLIDWGVDIVFGCPATASMACWSHSALIRSKFASSR